MRKFHLTTALAVLLVAFALAACRASDRAAERGSNTATPPANNQSATVANASSSSATSVPVSNPAQPAASASPAADNHEQPSDGVRRIAINEFQSMYAKGEAILVDVRDPDSFKHGHIKGALSIPGTELDAHLSQLPKDKLIVFYCA